MGFPSWRSIAATWGGAAFLLLRQFGVPTTSPMQRETRIAEVQEAGTNASDLERLADGRVLTVPLEPEDLNEVRGDTPAFNPN